MFEYVAFNPYNASPESLALELTKKSSEGWEVVSIVPTPDGRYCAFLRRKTVQIASQSTAEVSAPVQEKSDDAVPAQWYADPSGRFELRYWNGKDWTEHVARSGQQFTDPPIA